MAILLALAWTPVAEAANSDQVLMVPLEASLSFANAGTARGAFDVQDKWHLQWGAQPDAPLDFAAFQFTGSTVAVHYQIRAVRPEQQAIPEKLWPETGGTLRDFSVDLAVLPSPQEIVMAGWGNVAPTFDATETTPWSLTTVPAGTVVADQPYKEALYNSGVLHGPTIKMEGALQGVQSNDIENLYLYGFNVTIHNQGPDRFYRTGTWTETLPGPLGPVGVELEGLLTLHTEESNLTVSSPSRPARVYAPAVAIEGSLAWSRLSGDLRVDGIQRVLHEEPVDLSGTMVVTAREAAEADFHYVDIAGSANAASGPAAPRGPAGSSPKLQVAAAVVTGAILLPLVAWWLYTRLRKDEILEQPERGLIFAAVEANPGIGVQALAERVGLHSNTVRYHLQVLQCNGRVRSYRTRGAWCFVAAGVDLMAAQRQSMVSLDPKVAELVSSIGPQGLLASRAVAQIQARWGLSRSKSWEVVNRAVGAHVLLREVVGRRIRLRPVLESDPGPPVPSESV